jgi:hypothetical protein
VANEFNSSARPTNLVLFVWLLGASIVAIVAQSPALLFLLDPARPTPFANDATDPVPIVIGFGVINSVVSAVAIAVGLRLEPSVRMGVPVLRSWLSADRTVHPRSTVLIRCTALAFGLATFVLASAIALRSHLPELPDNFVFPRIWQGILMMLGAAIREEILFRFFALNLFTWLAMKICRKQEPTIAIMWTTNVLVAWVFACMHLIPVAPILELNATAMGAAIAVATVAGILLGWVYWRHGLLMGMFTHAIGGVLIYLGGRGLIAFAS